MNQTFKLSKKDLLTDFVSTEAGRALEKHPAVAWVGLAWFYLKRSFDTEAGPTIQWANIRDEDIPLLLNILKSGFGIDIELIEGEASDGE